jgi:DedD protein
MDTALKQRLVGASVLIALAVVVLPMLLGGRPDSENRQPEKIELPPQPSELDFETRRYPVGEQARPRPDTPSQTTPRPLPTPTPPVQEDTQTAPLTQAETDSEPAEIPEMNQDFPSVEIEDRQEPEIAISEGPPPAAPGEDAGRYVVQVASFGAIQNANRLSDTLRAYGYAVLLDSVKSDVGTLHRVRVGPFAGEDEADAAVRRLQTQVDGVRPRVMDLQPEKSAQVTRPSDPLVRWIVQVGSFSSADNADKLVARLRLESLTAYKEEVSASGSTIFRVRIGPFLEREEAIRADDLVNERLSIDGVVMSAD